MSKAQSEQTVPGTGEQGDPDAPNENESPNKVAYRAEFYQYIRVNNREQKPQLRRSREDTQPIPTSRVEYISSKPKGNSIFEVTTMYALPKGRDIAQMPSSGTEVLAEIGIYITIRSKLVLDILQDIVDYYPACHFKPMNS